ncbi:MAG: hypothetical protein MZV70_37920 [Desulfobacterales bacterium]|nr:hypothetical protein [Desulfobacterales bacterium]
MTPVLAGAAAGLVVGAVAMYLRPESARAPAGSGRWVTSPPVSSWTGPSSSMARRNTVDYLEKSQYMLLDMFDSAEQGPVVPAAIRAERARDLVQKKRYLNAQLERYQMAKAKAICDQIELLFRELAQVSDELPAAELGRLRGFVEERQLLLKINLVKKELQSGV